MTNEQIIAQFRALEAKGRVKIEAERECENYFDVYGEPEDPTEVTEIENAIKNTGLWRIATYTKCPRCGQWEEAESVGMCTGYNNPCDPKENENVIDLMFTAILQEKDP